MEVSSVIGGTSFSVLSLQNQARQLNARQQANDLTIARAPYRQQIQTENVKGSDWIELRPGIDAAVAHLEAEVARIEDLRDQVRTLIRYESEARTADSAALDQLNLNFSTTLRALNQLANTTSLTTNLIGTEYGLEVSYFANPELDVAAVYHRDLSNDYALVEQSGAYWLKTDLNTDVALVQYDSSGTATGKEVIINQDIRVDDITGSTIDFTIFAGTDAEESFTNASISTSGLGVLDAWAYGDLATTEGRALAESTLRTAISTLNSNLAELNGALAQARFDSGLAQVTAEGAGTQISNLNQRQLLELQELKNEATNRDIALSAAISSNNVLRNGYVQLLGIDPRTSLLDINV